jgi:hypothetical protein
MKTFASAMFMVHETTGFRNEIGFLGAKLTELHLTLVFIIIIVVVVVVGRRVIGMLNSVLWSKIILHVPGFSRKYFTIWGRNMDTKHTTG